MSRDLRYHGGLFDRRPDALLDAGAGETSGGAHHPVEGGSAPDAGLAGVAEGDAATPKRGCRSIRRGPSRRFSLGGPLGTWCRFTHEPADCRRLEERG
jgi:hypothetical protein